MAQSVPSDYHSSPAPEPPDALAGMLLQRHRSAITSRVVVTALGRLLSAGVIIYVSIPPRLTVTQIAASALIATIVTTVWFSEATRLARQLLGLEETLARRTGGDAEDLYIESRYFLIRSRFGGMLSYYEPAVWLWAAMVVLVLSATLNGVTA